MKIKKNIGFGVSFLSVFMINATAKEIIEDTNVVKVCSFLKENTSNEQCIKEQKDELLIKTTSGRGFDYLFKEKQSILNTVKSPIGLHHFAGELESKILDAATLNKNKEEQIKEFDNVRDLLLEIKTKQNLMANDYEKDISKWLLYKDASEEDNQRIKDFAYNRNELFKRLDASLNRMTIWTSSLDYYLKNKEVNKFYVLPLYLGEKISVSPEYCKIIQVNVPEMFKEKKGNIEGC